MTTSAEQAYRISILVAKSGKPFRILPAGVFRSEDGRPENVEAWRLGDSEATALIQAFSRRPEPLLIDYEHASLSAADPAPVPAAGWINRLEWRTGNGLFATDVLWTDKAHKLIASMAYRFISPVFRYSPVTGAVLGLLSVGLVNTPALAGLTDLAALSIALRPSTIEPQGALSDCGCEDRVRSAFASIGIDIDAEIVPRG